MCALLWHRVVLYDGTMCVVLLYFLCTMRVLYEHYDGILCVL